MEEFLDRLMIAESGGRLHKKNPRSTALGPFQFIESTFLFVVNRHFPSEVAGLTKRQVLALRTDMGFSRRAAAAYVDDLISALQDEGLPVTTVNVRLAFLVGPFAAVRLLKAPPHQPLRAVLSADAIAANPYMSGATVAKLVRRAAADVAATVATRRLGPSQGEPAATTAALDRESAGTPAAVVAEPAVSAVVSKLERGATLVAFQNEPAAAPGPVEREPAGTRVAFERETAAITQAGAPVEIECEIGLASCRRWIALQERKGRVLVRSAQR